MPKNLLVLGGTGLVGSNVCRAAVQAGYEVVSLTRRGAPTEGSEAHGLAGVDWRSGNAAKARDVLFLVREVKPDAIIHCIGVLFDCQSLLYSYNREMSGCDSIPDPTDGTYENIIKNTAMSAFHAVAVLNQRDLPFIFMSTCEVGWLTYDNGILGRFAGICSNLVPSLSEYLARKREVEDAMVHGIGVPDICRRRSYAARPVVFRPSVVCTEQRPRGCLATLMAVSPVSDGAVSAGDLAKAVLTAVEDTSVRGIYRRRDIVGLAKRATHGQ